MDELLRAGYRYVVDAELKSYFDTIPHEKLMKWIEERVADGRVGAYANAEHPAEASEATRPGTR